MAAQRLAKLAAISRQLTAGVEKRAFIGGVLRLAGSAGKVGLKMLDKYPKATLTGALGTGMAAVAGKGAYQQHKAGFDPEVQKAMLGNTPVPPGVS